MKWPINYEKYFTDSVILITGVGRSGTTILGKLIGSMNPAYYLFEPNIFKIISINPPDRKMLQAIIFEDYILPIVQGRGNENVIDDSCHYNYHSYENIQWRRNNLRSRDSAISYIEEEKPYFVFKIPEFQGRQNIFTELFVGAKVINIIRDMEDVIGSMVKKGWYTDNYHILDVCNYGGSPTHITNARKIEGWRIMSQKERCEAVYRSLISKSTEPCKTIIYEDLLDYPDEITKDIEIDFKGLKSTELTNRHIESIKEHKKAIVSRKSVD